MSLSITWHGHATFSIDVNGTKLVIDPFFDGNPAMDLPPETNAASQLAPGSSCCDTQDVRFCAIKQGLLFCLLDGPVCLALWEAQ